MSHERLKQVFEFSYDFLRKKVNSGRIKIDNEASLQLHFAAILKTVGELFEIEKDEFFHIELEKAVTHEKGVFGKSGSKKANIDIFYSFVNTTNQTRHSCAIEMKFFKKGNMREPNNRYDTFADIHNLENYGAFAECCFLVVATDHDHYVTQDSYSANTAGFDFRDNHTYSAGTTIEYKTSKPYGNPITLKNSYSFVWDRTVGGRHFLKLSVSPISNKDI